MWKNAGLMGKRRYEVNGVRRKVVSASNKLDNYLAKALSPYTLSLTPALKT